MHAYVAGALGAAAGDLEPSQHVAVRLVSGLTGMLLEIGPNTVSHSRAVAIGAMKYPATSAMTCAWETANTEKSNACPWSV